MSVMQEQQPDLAQLFHQYGSDKDRNGYAPCYAALLTPRRESIRSVLEIGIGTMIEGVPASMRGYALGHYSPGGSLRAWRDFFPHADVVGVDIQPDTQFSDDRITTHLADST